METQSFLSLCKDIAHFLFSILHLLLTRILPLIAMFVGSLLLHLFRLFISLLFSWPVFSTQAAFFKKRRSLQGRSAPGSAAFYRDALQEEPICSDDERALYTLQDDAICSDEDGASALQEERFEDCLDEDENFIEQQRLLLTQYEEMKLMRVSNPANGDQRRDEGNEQNTSNKVGNLSQKAVGNDDLRQERGNRPPSETVGDSLRRSRNGEENSVKKEIEVGNYLKEVGDLEEAAGLESDQGSLFPSDLPPSLDDVVNAATASERSSASLTTRRALPPTLSNVQKALQDMKRSEQNSPREGRRAAAAAAAAGLMWHAQPPNPASRTSSYDLFMGKFKHHFKLDGR